MKTRIYENASWWAARRVEAHYRPGTSDEDVLREVVERRCYRRARAGFDVEAGEAWLDLGANIGAFVLYARLRGAAEVDAFEPDPACFALLDKNAGSIGGHRVRSAVTNRRGTTVSFYQKNNPLNHWRGTIVPVHGYVPTEAVPNTHGSFFSGMHYDGVKMDIEGSEFGLLDDGLLPVSSKLVFEYHFHRGTRDLRLFARRVRALRKIYKDVWYPAFIDRDIAAGRDYSGRFDSLVFCWNRR